MRRRAMCAATVWLALAGGLVAILLFRPACPIYSATGLLCAGCGGSRMFSLLLRGQWAAAFWQNPYLFCALPLCVLYGVGETTRYVRGRSPLWRGLPGKLFLATIIAAGLAFAVLRNL